MTTIATQLQAQVAEKNQSISTLQGEIQSLKASQTAMQDQINTMQNLPTEHSSTPHCNQEEWKQTLDYLTEKTTRVEVEKDSLEERMQTEITEFFTDIENHIITSQNKQMPHTTDMKITYIYYFNGTK